MGVRPVSHSYSILIPALLPSPFIFHKYCPQLIYYRESLSEVRSGNYCPECQKKKKKMFLNNTAPDHYVTINLGDEKIFQIWQICCKSICHHFMYPNAHRPCFCELRAIIKVKNTRQTNQHELRWLGWFIYLLLIVHCLPRASMGSCWHTQTIFQVTASHIAIFFRTQHFWV